jgi:hypothetical protein
MFRDNFSMGKAEYSLPSSAEVKTSGAIPPFPHIFITLPFTLQLSG